MGSRLVRGSPITPTSGLKLLYKQMISLYQDCRRVSGNTRIRYLFAVSESCKCSQCLFVQNQNHVSHPERLLGHILPIVYATSMQPTFPFHLHSLAFALRVTRAALTNCALVTLRIYARNPCLGSDRPWCNILSRTGCVTNIDAFLI